MLIFHVFVQNLKLFSPNKPYFSFPFDVILTWLPFIIVVDIKRRIY